MDTTQVTIERLGLRLGVGRTAEVYVWDEARVLKLFRDDIPHAWVRHEAHVARIVADANLPAPIPGDVLVEIDGRLGIIYTRVDGMTMLDTMQRQPDAIPALGTQLGALHALLHSCECSDLPEQKTAQAHAIERAPLLAPALKNRALERLAQLPGGTALCHSDFHPENVILTERGPMIIDWMTACCGNPIADVARTVLILRVVQAPAEFPLPPTAFGQIRDAFLNAYLDAYRARRPFPAADLDHWLPVLAAARLAESIPGEDAPLMQLIETL